MRHLLAIAPLLLAACGAASPAPSPKGAAAAPLFAFHTSFWISLHERLYGESSPRARPRADAAPEWAAAVELYRRRYPDRGLLAVFAPDLLERRAAWDAVDDGAAPAGLEPEVAAAAAVYRRGLWEEDRRVARDFIDRLQPLIEAHGAALAAELAGVYLTPWPDAPVDVFVTPFAGPVGAFTSDGPPRIAIAGGDERHQDGAALEILFHEASHVLVGKVMTGLETAARAQGLPVPEGLWHALIFFTAGELAARRLGPGYIPYAVKNGLYDRVPGWPRYQQALRAEWGPYLDGKIGLDAALAAVVRAAQP